MLTPHSEHPIDWNNVISNPSGKPAASQSTTDQSRKWQVSETFAKINYNFQHVAASLKIIRICTDDCEASCENVRDYQVSILEGKLRSNLESRNKLLEPK